MEPVISTVLAVSAAVVSAVLVGFAIYTSTPAYRRRAVRTFAKQVGLVPDEVIGGRLEKRLLRRTRAGLTGVAVGLAGSVGALLVLSPSPEDATAASWVVAGSALVGGGVGAAIAALTQRLPDPAPGPRVARSRDVALEDYVTAGELVPIRILVPVAALVAVAAWIATTVGAPTGVLLPAATVAAGGAVVAQLAFELAARALVSRPVRAESADVIAWDDALRATILRQLLTAPASLAAVSLVWGMFALLTLLPSTAGLIVANVAFPVLLTGGAVLLGITLNARPQRHFLRRLWPELDAAANAREREAILAGQKAP